MTETIVTTTDVKNISNCRLIDETKKAIREERLSTTLVVKCFQEIYDRRLYLERGYPSLFEMATKYFGYCAGSAQRRINSMKLVRELPEIGSSIESGELSLTTASTLHGFFAAEATLKAPYSKAGKLKVIQSCLGKSTREVERELVTISPEREKRESFSYTAEDRLRISLSISDDLYQKLNRLKDIWSHSNPSLSTEILLEKVVEMALDKVDPIRINDRMARKCARRRNVLGEDTRLY